MSRSRTQRKSSGGTSRPHSLASRIVASSTLHSGKLSPRFWNFAIQGWSPIFVAAFGRAPPRDDPAASKALKFSSSSSTCCARSAASASSASVNSSPGAGPPPHGVILSGWADVGPKASAPTRCSPEARMRSISLGKRSPIALYIRYWPQPSGAASRMPPNTAKPSSVLNVREVPASCNGRATGSTGIRSVRSR